MTRIHIFDTTLRDGEQSPGCSMNIQEKLDVAIQLERLGVDVIEAGFAISSKGDFESIEQIAKQVRTPIICSLCRALPADIDAAAQSVRHAAKPRIHTFIATSPIHMSAKLRMSPDDVLQRAVAAVTHAKQYVDDVEFSCEDAGRSDPAFLIKVISSVIRAGATVVNIPDTVGYLLPHEFGNLIHTLMTNVPNIRDAIVSVHCHDDLGFATANAMAGVLAGATQVECTINGIGERAGNTALEEIVMALHTRSESLGMHTGIVTTEITPTSRLVSSVTGSLVQANKAIVGANAFAHESGIHQDGVLKSKLTYEIMDASSVGLNQATLVLGKHSGRHAFTNKLTELGYHLAKDAQEKAFERFKGIADTKKTLSDADIHALVADEVVHVDETYHLNYIQIIAGNRTRPLACVQLTHNGQLLEGACVGAGPVDAIFKTIDQLIKDEVQLVDFSIHSVTGGTDALGEVTIRIQDGHDRFTGRGADLDVLVASAKAYIQAINKMLSRRKDPAIKATTGD